MKKRALMPTILIMLALLFVLVPSVVYAQIVWGSYNDSRHRAQDADDDFTSGQETVYMYGTGFQGSYSYKVAYYEADTDGAGTGDYADKVETDLVSSTAGGKLSSECTFTAYPTSDEGTWQAVVYDASYDPPSVYVPSDPSAVADDGFYVRAEAIPEFSTVFAAIAVAGLCFGIYYWMRKRYRRQAATA